MPARRYDGDRRGYSPVLAERICHALAEGRSLRSICKDKGMPTERTTYRWLADNAEFRARYALAHELKAHLFVDEILEIADSAGGEWIDRDGRLGDDSIRRARLRIGTRKWMLAIHGPVKYRGWLSGEVPVTGVIREIVEPARKKAASGE